MQHSELQVYPVVVYGFQCQVCTCTVHTHAHIYTLLCMASFCVGVRFHCMRLLIYYTIGHVPFSVLVRIALTIICIKLLT